MGVAKMKVDFHLNWQLETCNVLLVIFLLLLCIKNILETVLWCYGWMNVEDVLPFGHVIAIGF